MTRGELVRLRRAYRERRAAFEAAEAGGDVARYEWARQALNEAVDRLAEAGAWRPTR